MTRPLIVAFVVMIFAIFTGSASAQHRVLLLHPGETRTFDAVNRGDTVLCRRAQGASPNSMSRHSGHCTMNGQACAHTLDRSHQLFSLS
jgi:hypothetical protein